MKVQVTVKNSCKGMAANSSIEAIVTPTDTASTFLERISEATDTLCFPNQQLLFKGQVLPDSQRLVSGGVSNGDVLEFLFEASEKTLAEQLSGLLGTKALSPEELSLLYARRHFVPLSDALKAMGFGGGKLKDFLDVQKCFSLVGDLVKVVETQKVAQPTTSLCPIEEDKVHGPIEVTISVQVHVPGKTPESLAEIDDDCSLDSMRLEASDTVANAKKIIAAFEQIPFPDCDVLCGGNKLEDSHSLNDAGVTSGCCLVLLVHASEASLASQLEDLLWERAALSPNELSLHYCQRHGTPVCQALRTLGLHSNLRRFLESQAQFSLKGGCVTLANGPELVTPE